MASADDRYCDHPTPSHCRDCPLRGGTELGGLGDEELRYLEPHITRKHYRKRETILLQGGAGLVGVAAGTLAVRKSDEEGNSVLVQLVHPGELFGQASLFSGQPAVTEVKTLTAATLCFIERAAMETLLVRRPALGLAFLRSTARRLGAIEENLLEMAYLPARARIARLLIGLKEHHGQAVSAKAFTLRLPLARQDIASLLSIRPETVARTVRALAEDGIALFDGRTVHVPDLAALRREGGAPA